MIWIIDQIWDNKLDLIWITDMITNKITDRITDKITDMTSKLQMLITFATVVRLRPTIYQNAQNSEENLDNGIWYTIFCQKKASNCLNFVFKANLSRSGSFDTGYGGLDDATSGEGR